MQPDELTISDAFVEVLGNIIAAKQKEFDFAINQIIAVRDAEFKSFKAEMQLMLRDAIDAAKISITSKLESLRDGKDGSPGPEGPTGPIGPAGLIGPTGPAGMAGEKGMRGERGDLGPQGSPGFEGDKGERGYPGERGEKGEKGEKGDPGRDGMPGRDGLNGSQGERGDRGTNGRDGLNGKDGAGFETWSCYYDGERQITFKCGSGDAVKQYTFDLPIPIDRGRYKAGNKYNRGDEVTFGGNIYRASKETVSKPGEDDDWRVAANRGRDGRDGKDGSPGPQGPEGKPGRDLTQLGPDGKKW